MKTKNPQYGFIKKHLKSVTHPTFAKFVSAKEEEITKKSSKMCFESSLKLQNKWIDLYNNVLTVERPTIETTSRSAKTNSAFKNIHIQAKAIINSRAQISATICYQAESSAFLLRPTDNNNDGSSEEEEDDENEGDYKVEIKKMAVAKLLDPKYKIKTVVLLKNCRSNNISCTLYKKAQDIFHPAELLKSLLSNILNFTNPQYKNIYHSLIPSSEINKISEYRLQQRKELGFDIDMNVLVDELFDQLDTCTTSDKLHMIIDELKYKEFNKKSPKCQLLNAVKTCKRV